MESQRRTDVRFLDVYLKNRGAFREELAAGLLIAISVDSVAFLSVRNLSGESANPSDTAATLSATRSWGGSANGFGGDEGTCCRTAISDLTISDTEIAFLRSFDDSITTDN